MQDHKQEFHPRRSWTVLHGLELWLETPMIILSFAWVALVVAELVWGGSRLLEVFGVTIWIIFIAEFTLRLALAPDRLRFLKSNWLTVIALAVPALRIFVVLRFFRFTRALRGVRLVRIVGTANRSMNALRLSFGRRGFGYVMVLTVLVALLGAAGMLAFESASEVPGGFRGYGDALWWTAMILTTMGSAFWPVTIEGRLLCLLLSIYGFTVFGYITASFATLFIGQEARSSRGPVAGSADVSRILRELALLRVEVRKEKEESAGHGSA